MSTEQVLSISQRRPKNKKYDSLMVFVCLWLMVKTNIWLPHFCPRKRSVAKIEEINLLILGEEIYLLHLRPIKISSIFMTFMEFLVVTKSFMPMANFEVFHGTISSSITPLFLKSVSDIKLW